MNHRFIIDFTSKGTYDAAVAELETLLQCKKQELPDADLRIMIDAPCRAEDVAESVRLLENLVESHGGTVTVAA